MSHGRRLIRCGLLVVALAGLPGCSMFKSAFYELQPYRLHRWNRGDAMGGGSEAYFSVKDPIPAQSDNMEVSYQQAPADVHGPR